MQINNVSEAAYLEEIRKLQQQQVVSQVGTDTSSGQNLSTAQVDMYIPSETDNSEAMAIPSEMYNQYGMTQSNSSMYMGMPPMGPPPTEETESTDETDTSDEITATTTAGSTDSTQSEEETAVTSSIQSLLDDISSSMRVNEDSILSTLNELGLSTTDLLDSDNLQTLTDALNEKASEMGLTQVDDYDSVLSSLQDTASSSVSSIKDTYSLDDDSFEALLEQLNEKYAQMIEEMEEEETQTDSVAADDQVTENAFAAQSTAQTV